MYPVTHRCFGRSALPRPSFWSPE